MYEREGIKECYVFKDESNERAPTIIHFVLCNIQYQKFSKPGLSLSFSINSDSFRIKRNASCFCFCVPAMYSSNFLCYSNLASCWLCIEYDVIILGVLREPGDNSANFSIFDTPKNPYSTFNFQYSNQAFDQLHDLMEFNTLLHVEVRLLHVACLVKTGIWPGAYAVIF